MTTTERDTILLVDDDPQVLRGLHDIFEDDYIPLTAHSGDEAIRLVEGSPVISAVVLDIKMPGKDGITTARAIAKLRPDLAIIFHTGYPGDYDEYEIQNSERPFDYVEKGMSGLRLIRTVQHAVAQSKLTDDNKRLLQLAENSFSIIGRSSKMLEVFRLIRKIGPTNSKVMILGESGTGKELVARALHAMSLRAEKRLAIFNCNHKSADLVESELFGHTRGAFTGAITDRVGLFEHNDGGTIFLDEIGDLDITTQAKLLRVIETGEFQRIGTNEVRKCDVRILCATNHDMDALVKDSKFRLDLYYRLRGIEIRLPALRDRREDIPLLVENFLNKFTVEIDMPPRIIDHEAMAVLINFSWPANVRDLKRVIEGAIVIGDEYTITRKDVEYVMGIEASNQNNATVIHRSPLALRIREFKKSCIIEALNASEGNISKAAQLLGIDRSNLKKDMDDFSLPRS